MTSPDTTPHQPWIQISFAPAWWHRHYGMDFGEDVWRDPIRRTERDREQRRLLFERFGDIGLGEADPAPQPNVQAYGHRFMAALWGCAIRYLTDQDPAAIPLADARRQMETLQVPDLERSPVVQRALKEAQRLREHYGRCNGEINFGGPLNNAVSVFGDEMLLVCLEEPDLARQVLHQMSEAILRVHDQVVCAINNVEITTPRTTGFGIGNCPVCMISPQVYREVVRPADAWLFRQFREAGIHHCGVFHPYAEAYRELNPNGLDIGWGTDLRATRRCFPQTPITLQIQEIAIRDLNRNQIDALVTQMFEEAGPSKYIDYLWLAEAGPDLSDQTVRDFMTVPERITIP